MVGGNWSQRYEHRAPRPHLLAWHHCRRNGLKQHNVRKSLEKETIVPTHFQKQEAHQGQGRGAPHSSKNWDKLRIRCSFKRGFFCEGGKQIMTVKSRRFKKSKKNHKFESKVFSAFVACVVLAGKILPFFLDQGPLFPSKKQLRPQFRITWTEN